MKRRHIYILYLILSNYNTKGQSLLPEFEFNLYVSDSLHRIDSVTIGYDTRANPTINFIDTAFGEYGYPNGTINLLDTLGGKLYIITRIPDDFTYRKKVVLTKTSCGRFQLAFNSNGGASIWINIYNAKLPLKIWWSKGASFKTDSCKGTSFIQTNFLGPLQGDYVTGSHQMKAEDTIYLYKGSEDPYFYGLISTIIGLYFTKGTVPLFDHPIALPSKYFKINFYEKTLEIQGNDLNLRYLRIVNMQGQVLMSDKILANETTFRLDRLTLGVYVMQAQDHNGRLYWSKFLWH